MLSTATMNNLSPAQYSFSNYLKPSISIYRQVKKKEKEKKKVQLVGRGSNDSSDRSADYCQDSRNVFP